MSKLTLPLNTSFRAAFLIYKPKKYKYVTRTKRYFGTNFTGSIRAGEKRPLAKTGLCD